VLLGALQTANAAGVMQVNNTSSGTAANAGFSLLNNAGGDVSMQLFGTGFTTSGLSIANTARIRTSSSVAGLYVGTGTTAPVVFFRSDAESMRLQASSNNVSIGTVTDLGQLGVDNGATAESIFVARDNGTAVFTVGDGGAVDISNGSLSLTIGADNVAITRTNATAKNGRFSGYHYTNAEEPVSLLNYGSTATDNSVSIRR
jgi:hypothetical protein